MTKKIFAISTLLLVLVIGALFVYNFIFKKPTASEKSTATIKKTADEGKAVQATDTTATSSSSKENSPITAILSEPVFGATLSPDGNSLYYFAAENGQLNQADLSGKLIKVLSTEQFPNIKKIIWNKPKNKAIIKTEPATGNIKYLLLDLTQKKVVPLKDNVDSVAWSNEGDKIIYKYYIPKTKQRLVSISDPDGSNWRDIANFDYQNVSIDPIPNTSLVAFWPSPNAYTSTSLNTIGFNGEGKKEIVKDRFGSDFLWSPSGTEAIVSASDQKGGHRIDLFLMNADGGQFQTLVFPTFTSKCAWSKDSKAVYCALPGNISDTAILPNDWQENKLLTADTFWKIDITTGKKDRLIDSGQIKDSYDALAPFLSSDEKTLFFTNKSDGKLYKLSF
jgi:hypothetical protein